MKHICAILLASIVLPAFAQDKKDVILRDSVNNYRSISFENNVYTLVWSNSNNIYYKQEYLTAKDNVEKFNSMITIDVLLTDQSIDDIIKKKINELEKRKPKDPVVNHQVIENKETGEYLLDFLISDGDLYEWNAYRYKIIQTNKGKAILLFAYTLRSFEGAEIKLDRFFPYLEKNRHRLIASVASYTLPKITLKDQ